jgi:putative ABC transport system permease protein
MEVTMNLFNIASKNIKRNFYNYFVYFISMVFSIMIYFTFTSIQYNKEIQLVIGSSIKISTGFKAASIVIAIFAAIFIWYSNSFFTRKRKKEIALYSLLGVKKKQIGRMLFYETIVMGMLALGAGIILGSLLSKVFAMLLIKLMGFSTAIKFTISTKAVIATVITFAILFLIASIHGYTIIYRFKLIELFKAENKSEKEPKTSIIFSILSIVFIGGGYLLYQYALSAAFLIIILCTLILVVIGTYFLFSSFTIFVIKLAKKNKKKYYKGINMIGTSQLLYRIKSSSRTLATIAVLSATTLTAMGVCASIYYDFQTKQDIKYPFSYAVVLDNKNNIDNKVEKAMEKYPNNKLLNSVDMEFIRLKGKLPNVDTLNNRLRGEQKIYVISESKYNEISSVKGIKEKISLKNSNEVILFDPYYMKELMESYTGKNVEINKNNEKTQFEIIDFKADPLINEHILYQILVVKDNIYNKYYDANNIIHIKAYNIENQKDSEKLTEELEKIVLNTYPKDNSWGKFSSYYYSYRFGLMSSGLLIFIAGFLGLVFLMATGSMIFFKQLSEATDDKERYSLLKKIGVNKKEIRTSIAKQLLFVFVTPLIVGIIHSCVAVSLLKDILNLNLTVPIGISVGAYTLIYMVYYILAVNSYSKIANSNL